MNSPKKSAQIALGMVYACLVLLCVAVVSLPWLVTWYVETMGRSPTLATTVMLTCYPCSPFAFAALLSLRGIMKEIIKGNTFCPKNYKGMLRVSRCCFIAAAAMIFAGYFYMPFYIAGAAAVFCATAAHVFADILGSGVPAKTDKEEN